MADHAKKDTDHAAPARTPEEERRRAAVARFYGDYKQLGRLADELLAIALALGIPLDRGVSNQKYARQVAALLVHLHKFKCDPDCKVPWPIPEEVCAAMPDSVRQEIIDFLTSVKARRDVRDGVEVVVSGPLEKTPAGWAQVMDGLGRDAALWKTVARLAALKIGRAIGVDTGANRRSSGDVPEVAAEIYCKILFSVVCRAHVWYKWRRKYKRWRNLLFSRLTTSAIMRAWRDAQGLKGMPRNENGGRICQLPDDPDTATGRTLGSSRDVEDPSEIVAQRERIERLDAFWRHADPADLRVQIILLVFRADWTIPEIADALCVDDRQARKMVAEAVEFATRWYVHAPVE